MTTGIRPLLRISNFRNLWFGQMVSDFGDGLTLLTLLILVQRLTGSTLALAGMAIASTLPMILFSLPAGALVDRIDRRKAMIASDLVRGAVVLAYIFVQSADLVWALYVLGFVQASVSTVFNPAKAALLPRVVPEEQLLGANTVSQTSRVVFNLVGTAMAGILAAMLTNLWPVFVIDAMTFALSAVFIFRITLSKEESTPSREESSFLADITGGLKVLVSKRPLIGVLVAGSVAMLGLGAVNVLIVPLVVDVLGMSESWFGLLEGAQVIGMLLGGSIIAALATRFQPTRLVAFGMVAAGIGVGLIGMVSAAWQLGVIMFAVGFTVTPVQGGIATLAQVLVDDEIRGRVNAALNTVIAVSMVVSQAFAGVLAASVGVSTVFVVGGALTVLAGVLSGVIFASDRQTELPVPEPVPEAA